MESQEVDQVSQGNDKGKGGEAMWENCHHICYVPGTALRTKETMETKNDTLSVRQEIF